MNEIVERLKEFIENEMRSCSMDIGGITPEYVQRMWGGRVPLDDIAEAMVVLKSTSESMSMSKEEKDNDK
ncbi:MAG: hypothetical protein J6O49_10540 [Bacteroidaceae bacterium]|nr:hypothetical protein [Bacteroidaceae bacterium]